MRASFYRPSRCTSNDTTLTTALTISIEVIGIHTTVESDL
jgi:hypothetical protein